MKKFTPGQFVKCTAHDGRHTGKVVHVITPEMIAVSWEGYTAVPQTSQERSQMLDLADSHNLIHTHPDEIEKI